MPQLLVSMAISSEVNAFVWSDDSSFGRSPRSSTLRMIPLHASADDTALVGHACTSFEHPSTMISAWRYPSAVSGKSCTKSMKMCSHLPAGAIGLSSCELSVGRTPH